MQPTPVPYEPTNPAPAPAPALDRARARLSILRPGNAAMAAAGTLAGTLVAMDPSGARPGLLALVAAPLSAAAIAAFGNVLNDRNDAEIDRVAHPRRPIPSGRVTNDEATALLWFLLAGGLALAALAGLVLLVMAAASATLLALYERRLKARGLAGNAAVAWLVAVTFLYGAAVTGAAPAEWGLAWLLAGMAFLVNLARELLKDLQDKDADSGHRVTVAHTWSAPYVRLLAFYLVAAAVALSLLALWRHPPAWNKAWLGLLAPADGILLVGAMAAPRNVAYAQRLLKAGMLVALVAFVGASWPPASSF